jgi:hypothetical protein
MPHNAPASPALPTMPPPNVDQAACMAPWHHCCALLLCLGHCPQQAACLQQQALAPVSSTSCCQPYLTDVALPIDLCHQPQLLHPAQTQELHAGCAASLSLAPPHTASYYLALRILLSSALRTASCSSCSILSLQAGGAALSAAGRWRGGGVQHGGMCSDGGLRC